MKKLAFFVLLVLLVNSVLFSVDFLNTSSDENDNLTANLGVSFLYPILGGNNIGDNILASLLFTSLSAGVGYHFNILKNIIAPGIYGDMHLGFLTLLFNNEYAEVAETDDFVFVQTGIRLYNQFRFGYIDIQPFYGFNFLFAGPNFLGFYKFGALFAYKKVGIEYSCHVPFHGNIEHNLHRVAFVIHMR